MWLEEKILKLHRHTKDRIRNDLFDTENHWITWGWIHIWLWWVHCIIIICWANRNDLPRWIYPEIEFKPKSLQNRKKYRTPRYDWSEEHLLQLSCTPQNECSICKSFRSAHESGKFWNIVQYRTLADCLSPQEPSKLQEHPLKSELQMKHNQSLVLAVNK